MPSPPGAPTSAPPAVPPSPSVSSSATLAAILHGLLGPAVRNVRVGFATNSSSLHSLAVWTDGPRPDKYNTADRLMFGEEDFRLQSEGHKRAYMAAALVGSEVGQFSRSPLRMAQTRNWRLRDGARKTPAEVLAGCREAYEAWLTEAEQVVVEATGFKYEPGEVADTMGGAEVGAYYDGVRWSVVEALGVDNHSVIDPPRVHGANGNIHTGFYRAITDLIATDPRIVILGGEDNRGARKAFRPEIVEGTTPIGYRLGDSIPSGVARFDADLGQWVIFNALTGLKIHLDLSLPIEAPPTATATTNGDGGDDVDDYYAEAVRLWRAECPRAGAMPELLDVSITDYCATGCPFCYRGSTEAGQHASTGYLRRLAAACGDAGVFEVAIGGGEPTEHPDFVDVLRAFRDAGVVPNFTTRNVDYLVRMGMTKIPEGDWCSVRSPAGYAFSGPDDMDGSPEGVARAFDVPFSHLFGAVAISVDNAVEAQDAIDRLATSYGNGYRSKFCLQYIIGQSANRDDLEAILRVAGEAMVPVTLLGFKHTERGALYGDRAPVTPEGAEPWWVSVIDDLRKSYGNTNPDPEDDTAWPDSLRVGLDTVLAAQGAEHLVKRGLDPRCIVPIEGVCSAFVNAVRQTAHTSSYDQSAGVPLTLDGATSTNDTDELLEAWALVRNGGSGSSFSAGPARRSLPLVPVGPKA